ncbi:DUF4416 family protein [Desulfonatronovibrio hydrogenovorans]|uniref:DUF4416 family protein n=1 Tax=Desulfonatronovibrio hydrogenovorans TaxID=53245 RepID=UPI00048FD5EB|nr:DUF4416 family protein [Desulfonatronovibrio hydrogenovorans]
MSIPTIPKPGKPFLSILSSKWELFWPALQKKLEEHLGPADYLTDPFCFTETSYYDDELGLPISRRILSFDRLCQLDSLVWTKLFTNTLEQEHTLKGKRIFNLDPGILSMERLVLATGKNFTHRIYLGQGIWADLTLIFTKGDWQDLPWTFPDYKSEKIKTHLRTIRNRYHQQLSLLT